MSEVFEPFPKMARLTRECIITEKIDGTNAQINIVDTPNMGGDYFEWEGELAPYLIAQSADKSMSMFAGSRTRYITPEADNMGFARWVKEHAADLFGLGFGRHFGEWWGSKIQRTYGLTEKRFSLFNTSRWCVAGATPLCINSGDPNPRALPKFQTPAPACCGVVPELYRGVFSERVVDGMLTMLRTRGSVAAEGFNAPEGIVIFHTAAGSMFKKTLDNDASPKGATR